MPTRLSPHVAYVRNRGSATIVITFSDPTSYCRINMQLSRILAGELIHIVLIVLSFSLSSPICVCTEGYHEYRAGEKPILGLVPDDVLAAAYSCPRGSGCTG